MILRLKSDHYTYIAGKGCKLSSKIEFVSLILKN